MLTNCPLFGMIWEEVTRVCSDSHCWVTDLCLWLWVRVTPSPPLASTHGHPLIKCTLYFKCTPLSPEMPPLPKPPTVWVLHYCSHTCVHCTSVRMHAWVYYPAHTLMDSCVCRGNLLFCYASCLSDCFLFLLLEHEHKDGVSILSSVLHCPCVRPTVSW